MVAAGLAPWAPAAASARGVAHRATDCFTVTATIPLASAPNAVAVNAQTNTIYVASYEAGTVSVIDGQTNTVTATIRVGRSPQAITVGPRSKDIYVAK